MEQNDQTIDTAFEKLDASSKEFSLLEKISSFLATLKEKFKIEDERIDVIDGEITRFLLKLQNYQQLTDDLNTQLNLTEKEDVVKSIITEVKIYLKDVVPATKQEDTIKSAPSPADVLASLKSRLTTPTAIAPVARELAPGPKKSEIPPVTTPPSSAKPKVDPYRELPT